MRPGVNSWCFVVDVSLLTFRQIVELRTRPYERGAATPCIPCQRGLSTVEFHEGRLAEARTARPPTTPPGLAALPWLAVSVRLAKRRCLAYLLPRPAPPAATGLNEKTNLKQKKLGGRLLRKIVIENLGSAIRKKARKLLTLTVGADGSITTRNRYSLSQDYLKTLPTVLSLTSLLNKRLIKL